MKTFTHSEAFRTACTMPLGKNHQPKEEFSWPDSEVVQWLINQPEIQRYLFNKVHQTGAIVFDKVTRCWRGRDSN